MNKFNNLLQSTLKVLIISQGVITKPLYNKNLTATYQGSSGEWHPIIINGIINPAERKNNTENHPPILEPLRC